MSLKSVQYRKNPLSLNWVFLSINKGLIILSQAERLPLVYISRRLEADRFFTSNFNEETYTKKGLERVNTTESLKDVLDRHYPEMTKKWMNSSSAFSVWDSAPNARNPIPLYLRVPQWKRINYSISCTALRSFASAIRAQTLNRVLRFEGNCKLFLGPLLFSLLLSRPYT